MKKLPNNAVLDTSKKVKVFVSDLVGKLDFTLIDLPVIEIFDQIVQRKV